MVQKHWDERSELNSVKYAMKWYGWGSPIGLSIFLLALVIIAAIIKNFLF